MAFGQQPSGLHHPANGGFFIPLGHKIKLMSYPHTEIDTREPLPEWIAAGPNAETDKVKCFVAAGSLSEPRVSDPRSGKAYDITYDQERYRELRQAFSDRETRQIMLEEITRDLMTHFGELGDEFGRIGAFSYRYKIDETGTLIEDSTAKTPIRVMFEDQTNVVAALWQKYLITDLETMPVGSLAFTYSARDRHQFEGKYDYAYLFHKISASEIHCTGLELVLSAKEQAAILNRQYKEQQQYLYLLTDDPEPDEVRGRALVYPPNYFESISDAYAQIVGQVIKQTRDDWRFESAQDIERYVNQQERILEAKNKDINSFAYVLIDAIVQGKTGAEIQLLVSKKQNEALWKFNPDMMREAIVSGQTRLLLPCGFVDIIGNGSGDLRWTAGEGLVSSESWSYHIGTCRHCHEQHVEVGPCEICKKCERVL